MTTHYITTSYSNHCSWYSLLFFYCRCMRTGLPIFELLGQQTAVHVGVCGFAWRSFVHVCVPAQTMGVDAYSVWSLHCYCAVLQVCTSLYCGRLASAGRAQWHWLTPEVTSLPSSACTVNRLKQGRGQTGHVTLMWPTYPWWTVKGDSCLCIS